MLMNRPKEDEAYIKLIFTCLFLFVIAKIIYFLFCYFSIVISEVLC